MSTEGQDPVTLGEVSRGLDALRSDVRGMTAVVTSLPTREYISDTLGSRDRLIDERFKAMGDDFAQLFQALSTERAERIAADEREAANRKAADAANEERASKAKSLMFTAIGLTCTVLFSVIGLMANFSGATAR